MGSLGVDSNPATAPTKPQIVSPPPGLGMPDVEDPNYDWSKHDWASSNASQNVYDWTNWQYGNWASKKSPGNQQASSYGYATNPYGDYSGGYGYGNYYHNNTYNNHSWGAANEGGHYGAAAPFSSKPVNNTNNNAFTMMELDLPSGKIVQGPGLRTKAKLEVATHASMQVEKIKADVNNTKSSDEDRWRIILRGDRLGRELAEVCCVWLAATHTKACVRLADIHQRLHAFIDVLIVRKEAAPLVVGAQRKSLGKLENHFGCLAFWEDNKKGDSSYTPEHQRLLVVGRNAQARRTMILYVMQMLEREYPGCYTSGSPEEVVNRFYTGDHLQGDDLACAVIPFDSPSLRYLSGPRGVITRKLEMSTGAAVLFVGNYMFILGSQNQIWHVKDYITILLAQWDATIAKRSDGCVLVTDSRPDACFLDIPKFVLSGVLGPNLMTLHEVENMSGCLIFLNGKSSRRNTSNVCVLSMFQSHRESAVNMLYDLMQKEFKRQSHTRAKSAQADKINELPPLEKLLKQMPWSNWVTPDNSPAEGEKHEPAAEPSPLAASPQSVRSAKATVNAFGMSPSTLDPAPQASASEEKDLTVLSHRPCMDFIWADVEVSPTGRTPANRQPPPMVSGRPSIDRHRFNRSSAPTPERTTDTSKPRRQGQGKGQGRRAAAEADKPVKRPSDSSTHSLQQASPKKQRARGRA